MSVALNSCSESGAEKFALDVQQFISAETLAESVAIEVAECLRTAISRQGTVSLVVSGGKSPATMFRHLSSQLLDWEKVTVTLADERWVSPRDPESNESMVRQHLLVDAAAAARFIPLKTPSETPAEAIDAVSALLTSVKRPFDLVLLGMGADGHTASWFPDAPLISNCLSSESLCYPIESPAAAIPRMTLTPRAILEARLIMLMFSGRKKQEVFDLARLPGDSAELPVRTVLRQRDVPVMVRFSA